MINLLTYGLSRILIQILLIGLSICRILKDFVANWGQFSSISMSKGWKLRKVRFSSSLPSIRAVLLPRSVKMIVKGKFRNGEFLPNFFTILLLIVHFSANSVELQGTTDHYGWVDGQYLLNIGQYWKIVKSALLLLFLSATECSWQDCAFLYLKYYNILFNFHLIFYNFFLN